MAQKYFADLQFLLKMFHRKREIRRRKSLRLKSSSGNNILETGEKNGLLHQVWSKNDHFQAKMIIYQLIFRHCAWQCHFPNWAIHPSFDNGTYMYVK